MEFTAAVQFIDQPSFGNLSEREIVRGLPADYPRFFVFVVDSQTIQGEEHALLVVGFSPRGDDPKDFERKPLQTPSEDIKSFRAIPSSIQSIENNLSIANMDFEDFAAAVSEDGFFRGFKG